MKSEKQKKAPKYLEQIKGIVFDIVLPAAVVGIILLCFSSSVVRQTSMQPTLNDGDYIIVNKINPTNPDINDIVIFRSDMKDDEGKEKMLIKRVAGLEGDIITIDNGKFYRNGKQIKEKYIFKEEIGHVYNFVVPKGHFYALGDHRENSLDSRTIGAIPVDRIYGRAILRVYPFSDFGFIK
ncbi:MAG: signal peptidase I [Eubacteriales bacterium]|nr:signal peptidase I [Eubacteriales bacterium]MDY3333255.1 signal peptidase I [Gallibacter sp.]